MQKAFILVLWTRPRPLFFTLFNLFSSLLDRRFRKVGQISYFLGLVKYLNMVSLFLVADIQRITKRKTHGFPQGLGRGDVGERKRTLAI